LQFSAELNSTNAKLAEEVEASADIMARSQKAERCMVDMALGFVVAVNACRDHKAARHSLKHKLEAKECHSAKLARERDVANLQVCCRCELHTVKCSTQHVILYGGMSLLTVTKMHSDLQLPSVCGQLVYTCGRCSDRGGGMDVSQELNRHCRWPRVYDSRRVTSHRLAMKQH
jgi:hypothetical protein